MVSTSALYTTEHMINDIVVVVAVAIAFALLSVANVVVLAAVVAVVDCSC